MSDARTGLLGLARSLARVFGVRVLEVGVRYGFTLALAVSLGVGGAGQIYLGISVITLAGAFARFGLDSVAMRRLAVAEDTGDRPAARGIVLLAVGFAALGGGLLAGILWLGAPLLAGQVFGPAASAAVLRAIAFGALGLALQTLIGALLSALDRPIAGQFVAAVCWPLVALAYLLTPGADAPGTAWAITAAMLAAAAGGLGLILWHLGGLDGAALPRLWPMLRAARPLFGAELAQILLNNLPILALGLVAAELEVGRFGLASRLSLMLTILAIAMYAANAPRFARLHAARDAAGLAAAAHQASRMVAGAALPAALLLWLLPGPMLGLFGADFRPAAPLLVILAAGQFVNAATSQAHALLAMTGHERELWRNSALGAAVLAVGLAVLLPLAGATGAALATAIAYSVIGVANVLRVRQRLGIDVLAAFRRTGPAPAAAE